MEILKGSEKQIKWAEQIRVDMLEGIKNIECISDCKNVTINDIKRAIEIIDSSELFIKYKDFYKKPNGFKVFSMALDDYFEEKNKAKILEIEDYNESEKAFDKLCADIEENKNRNWWFNTYK